MQVPNDIPTTAAIIDLSHNEIKELKKTDFSHRLKLQEINLNYNKIEQLDREVRMLNGILYYIIFINIYCFIFIAIY